MNKVICEICGTSYPENADQCPICGYTHNLDAFMADGFPSEDLPVPEVEEKAETPELDPEEFSSEEPVPQEQDRTFEYDDEPREASALLVVLLIVVIAAMLAATAFIGVKYVLPNVLPPETEPPIVTTEAPTQETEPPTVPCTGLALTSGGTVMLEKEGQYWLLNVVILPADSTDKLTYESSDESVAVVNAEGRVTAVDTGEAVITIRCGDQALECRIICDIPEETTVPETSEETEPADETTETTDPT